MRKIPLFALLLLLMTSVHAKEEGWTSLFNGKDLSGWKQLNGEAKFEVEDEMIVGTTVANTPNSFLATEKDYSDFIFEVDLLLTEDMNSGIQFRSLSTDDYRDGRVHGYQAEVDPSPRAWSGGVFDEARRGWLYPVELNPEAQSAFKMGEWNTYRIECIGNNIRTWVNGVAVSHLIDDMTNEGFIALQVHSIPNPENAGHQIKWKNIRIKTENVKPSPCEGIYVVNLLANDLSKAEKEQGYKLLFDGRSTNKWMNTETGDFPKHGWKVEDGVLTVLGKDDRTEEEKGGNILTKEEFGPFEFKFDFNFTEGANSGIKYGIGNNGSSIGLEYQILDDENHGDAKNGVVGNRTLASLYDLIPADKSGRFVYGPDEWNRGRIVVYPDNTVQHWLNGRKVVEYVRGNNIYKALVARSKYEKYPNFGMVEKTPIHIQDHGNTVHFRSLKIREL